MVLGEKHGTNYLPCTIKDSQGMDEMKNPCLVLYVNLTEAISTDGLLLTDICKISFNGLLRKKHWLPQETCFLL